MRFKFSIFFVVVSIQVLFGQGLYDRHNVFNVIFDGSSRINPYYLSENPAFLLYDGADQLLSIEGNFRNDEGDFKKYFDPGTEKYYNLNFSGKKVLGQNQIFKGLFSLQRLERYDWNWLAVKNYNTGSPFLFGDSTSGKTRYSGILMNAQYSISITPELLTGISFTYDVDEGLKEISPRPTSDHRDIDINLGGAYKFTENFYAGLSFRAIDYLEEVNYKEDEGAIYTETILFKIRGYDYPLRIAKKVENRTSYHNKYFFNTDYFYQNSFLIASAYVGGGLEQITIKDDYSNPRNEGYWNNDLLKGGVNSRINLGNNWSTGLSYKFDQEQMWAKHPDYEVVIMEDDISLHKITIGIEHNFSESLSGGIELNSEFTNDELKDYYGNIGYSYSAASIGGLVGIDYRWTKIIKTLLALGYGQRHYSDWNLLTNSPSQFFLNSRYTDLLYLQNDYSISRVDFNTEIISEFPGIIKIYLSYQNASVKNSSNVFSSSSRAYFNAALELKVNVY